MRSFRSQAVGLVSAPGNLAGKSRIGKAALDVALCIMLFGCVFSLPAQAQEASGGLAAAGKSEHQHHGSTSDSGTSGIGSGLRAPEGDWGVGHALWHESFYSKLRRNDGKGSCCNLADCRPTVSRMVDDHYEVKLEGNWVSVPSDKINRVLAPDGGAHICAPRQEGIAKGVIFCVVLPPET